MQVEEAKILLGFPPGSRPDPSQVKAAYRKKVWESHPDLFPDDQKIDAESTFKSISEAYSCLASESNEFFLRIMVCKNPNELLVLDSFWMKSAFLKNVNGDVRGQRYYRAGVNTYSRVVKTGVPRAYASAKRGNPWLIGTPFLLIVLGTIGLGGVKANRAYNLQKQTFPSHNPFLP